MDRVQVAQAMHQENAICGCDGLDAIDPRSTLALVVLCDPPDGKGTGGSRFEQEPLQTVDHFAVATS